MNTSAKYQANWTETIGGVVRTRFCGQTDRPTDRLIPVYPPLQKKKKKKLRLRGYKRLDLDHKILLHKLKLHNFSSKSLAIFKFYLTDRKQCIEHNNTFSSSRFLSGGIPQGSILGPLLLLIYMNDM